MTTRPRVTTLSFLFLTVGWTTSAFAKQELPPSLQPPILRGGVVRPTVNTSWSHTSLLPGDSTEVGRIVPTGAILLRMAILESSATAPVRSAVMSGLFAPAPDHRWEGLVIGAVSLGASAAYIGGHYCRLSDSATKHCVRTAIQLGALGGFAGGIIGGLVGGMIPKAPSDSTN